MKRPRPSLQIFFQLAIVLAIVTVTAAASSQGLQATKKEIKKNSFNDLSKTSTIEASDSSLRLKPIQSLSLKSKYQIEWWLRLRAEHLKDDLANQKSQTLFRGYLNFQYDLTSFLDLRVQPRVNFRSGYVQSESTRESRSGSIELNEAAANFKYEQTLLVSAGALNQQKDLSGLVLSDGAFPAARLQVQVGNKDENYLQGIGQASVPTSSSLTNNLKEEEKTPTMVYSGFKTQFKAGSFKAKLKSFYFQYNNLPQSVAIDSTFLGNTANPTESLQSRGFLFEYRGYEAGLRLSYENKNQLQLTASGDFVQNQEAPSGLNQAYLFKTDLDFQFGNINWTPAFNYFRIEPDASVAYYNSIEYQTNRIGYITSLAAEYQKQFTIKFGFSERDAIYSSQNFGREKMYLLQLETSHELL